MGITPNSFGGGRKGNLILQTLPIRKSPSRENDMLRKLLLSMAVLSIVLSVCLPLTACSGGSFGIQNPIVIKEPDIRVESFRSDRKLNLSLGWYANVSYALHNYGEAAGQVTVNIYGTNSGRVFKTDIVAVPAKQTVVREVTKVDISSNDQNVGVEIVSQKKIQ